MIVEKIKRMAGGTRYCNCENTECSNGHGDSPCPDRATVIMATANGPVQLCPGCREYAEGRAN